jgi:ABC-type nitrate/sulfonate/bicarbonate transport system permease component
VHELRGHIGALRKRVQAKLAPPSRNNHPSTQAPCTRKPQNAGPPGSCWCAIVVLWQIICSAFNVSEFIFPSPWAIGTQLVEFSGVIAGHAWRTFWVTMAGFGMPSWWACCWAL